MACFIVCTAIFLPPPAAADYAEGVRKWNAGKRRAAELIWRRSGWQNDDYRSQDRLARLYFSDDPVESYVWSYLTTVSRMGGLSDRESKRREEITERARLRRQKLFYSYLSASERFEAQNRVIYILACRGATGLFVLGQLFEKDVEYIINKKHQISYSSDPRDYSVLLHSPRMALTFYKLASKSGLPYADEHLETLQKNWKAGGDNRSNEPAIDPRNADDWAEKWIPPFERYPGKGYPGKRYTDHCLQEEETRVALRQTRMLKLEYVQATLKRLGFFIGRVDGKWGEDTADAIREFQKQLEVTQTGRLTPELKVQIIQTAAILGDSEAQNKLGVMYYRGIGVKPSAVRAHKWFERAAHQNHPAALYHLGIVYGSDLPGLEKDSRLESYYINRSAYAGFKKTQAEIKRRIRAGRK